MSGLRWAVTFFAVSIACAACGSRDAPSGGQQASPEPAAPAEPAKPKPRKIAVIPKGTTHEFWKSVHAGANKAGKELGVEIIWKGPLREDDRDEQIQVVENFVGQGVDAIVLAPLDDTALVPVRDRREASRAFRS